MCPASPPATSDRIGVDLDAAGVAGVNVEAIETVSDGAGVDDSGMVRVEGDVPRLTPRHFVPALEGGDAVGEDARNGDGAVVLLRPVETVGELVVDEHAVELRRRLVAERGPRFSSLQIHLSAPVVRLHQDLGVVRVQPEVVAVAVEDGNGLEGTPSVRRLEEARVQRVDRLG